MSLKLTAIPTLYRKPFSSICTGFLPEYYDRIYKKFNTHLAEFVERVISQAHVRKLLVR
jgi:hypothetical protein